MAIYRVSRKKGESLDFYLFFTTIHFSLELSLDQIRVTGQQITELFCQDIFSTEFAVRKAATVMIFEIVA